MLAKPALFGTTPFSFLPMLIAEEHDEIGSSQASYDDEDG